MSFLNGRLTSYELRQLMKRVEDLEEKVFKTARKSTTTKSQQMLLLIELGMMEKIHELKISNKKKADLLSILLNASAENIEKDLSQIYKPDSDIKSEMNYKFLLQTFKSCNLKKHAEKIDIELDKIVKNNQT